MIPINGNEPMSSCSKCKEQQQQYLVQQSYCINCLREQDRGVVSATTNSFHIDVDDSGDEAPSRIDDYSLQLLPRNPIVTLRMRPRRWESSPEIEAAAILSSFRGERDEMIAEEESFEVCTPNKMVNAVPTDGASYDAFATPFSQQPYHASSPPPIKRQSRNTLISLVFSSPPSMSSSSSSSSSSTISMASPIPPRLLLPEL
jgi:hypothetical protein